MNVKSNKVNSTICQYCGVRGHSRKTHHQCLKNPAIKKSVKRCKCGSDTHARISSQFCPLNKRHAKNSLANQNPLLEYQEITLESYFKPQRYF